jgi:uncharacterized membrane protein (DUF485 family)
MQENVLQHSGEQKRKLDYSAIVQSSSFQQLMKAKKAFILPASLFFLAFYFTLPILTSYSTILNQSAIGAISWAWVFAFAQFIMTWVLCILYSKRATTFDNMIEKIKQEIQQRR